MKNRLYTIQEVANLLGVSTKTLRRWDQRGRFVPTRTAGNQRRYTEQQIAEFKSSSSAKATEGQVKFKVSSSEVPPLFSENEMPKEFKATRSLPSVLSSLPSGSFLKNHFLLKHASEASEGGFVGGVEVASKNPEESSEPASFARRPLAKLNPAKIGFVVGMLVLFLSFTLSVALVKFNMVQGLAQKRSEFAKFLENLPQISLEFKSPLREGSAGQGQELSFVPPSLVGTVLAAATGGSDFKLNINIPTFFSENVGIGTAEPEESALLDLTSEDQGFLAPRMTEAQLEAISAPAAGLFVYNTDTNHYNMYNGTSWQGVFTAIGDSTTGEAFTEIGTSGTSLFFYDADGRGQLTIANLSGVRKYTLPDASGEVSLLGQTISNAELVNSKVTISPGTNITGGGSVELGSSVTITLKDSIDLAGTLDVTGATILDAALTAAGATLLNGNVGLGDAATDTITFTGRVAADSDLIPIGTTGTNDLGTSALPWDNIYANNVIPPTSGTQGYWQRNSGALSPTNISDDVLIGATATSSAKFGFINVAGGTPTATISGDLTLDAAGVIRTTKMQTLTIGGSTTGNITLDSGSSAITLSDDTTISGDLAVNGSTSADITSTTTTGTLFNSTVTTLSLGGAATTLNIGTTDSVTRTINVGTGTGADTINIGTGATGADAITIGNNASTSSLAFTSGTGAQTFTSNVASGTTTTSGFVFDATAITSGTGIYAVSDSVTTGRLLDIATSGNTWIGNSTTNGLINIASASTGGTGSSSSILLNLSRSGANANATHTAYGIYSSVTDTGTTSVNVGGYFTATGASTNWAAQFAGNVQMSTGSDILAAGAGTDIGSSATRFATGWFDTIDATNIAGTVTGGSTSSSSWTINSDNATADTEDASLAFERGTTTPNSVILWDSTNDEIDFNSSINLTGTTSLTTQPLLALATSTAHTTGDIVDITSTYTPTAGGTQSALDVNITNSPSTNANTLRVFDIGLTDAGSLANTVYGLYVDVTTANASDTTYAATFLNGNVGIGDSTPAALFVVGDGDDFQIDSTGDITLNQTTPNIAIGNTGTLTVTDGTNTLFSIADDTSEGDVTVTGDLAVNGATSADITSSTTTGTLFNTTVTTLNIGGAATTIAVGAAASATTWTGQSISFTGANSTSNTTLTVTNTSNAAAASHSIVDVAVGGTTSTGDPQLRLTIPSGTSYYIGADNSNSDILDIGTGTTVGSTRLLSLAGAGGSAVFNDDSADINLRIETDENASALVLDAGLFAGVGQLSIGAAAQSTVTGFTVIDNPAVTATSNQDFYKLLIDNTAAVTVTGATTSPIVASLAIDEPNITATGTVTNATTLYIQAAPTEGGTGNYALWVDSGTSRLDGVVNVQDTTDSTSGTTGSINTLGGVGITKNLYVQEAVILGGALTGAVVNVGDSVTSGGNQYAYAVSGPQFNIGDAGTGAYFYANAYIQPISGNTSGSIYGMLIGDIAMANPAAATTVTTLAGLRVQSFSAIPANITVTTGYSIYSNSPTNGTTKYNIYADGTAQNYFGGNILINDTSNADMTTGLTINQGGADNHILTFKSSDVSRSDTGFMEADTYGAFQKVHATGGGLDLRVGATSAITGAGTSTLIFTVRGGDAVDTGKTTSSRGIVSFNIAEEQETNVTADGNLFSIVGRVGGANLTAFIVDEDGDTWQNGGITATTGTFTTLTGTSLDISGGVAFGSAASVVTDKALYIDNNFGESADANGKFGVATYATSIETTGSTADVIVGVLGSGGIAAGNTQAWTTAVGVRDFDAYTFLRGSAVTVTGAAGLFVRSPDISGPTLTNFYGVYVDALSGASNNYAFYSAGAGDVVINAAGTAATGRVAIGAAINTARGMLISPKVTASSGIAQVVSIGGTVTAAANGDILTSLGINSGESTTFATGAFTGLTAYALRIYGPNMIKTGTGTIDTAASIYIVDAPTIGTTNYALWVDAGTSRFDGDLTVDGDLDFTGPQEITTSTGDLTLNPATSEDVIIPDAKGLVIGNTAQVATGQSGYIPELQVLGTTRDDASLAVLMYAADAEPARLILGKSRATTIGTNTQLSSGDEAGRVEFAAANTGDLYPNVASIGGFADAAQAVNSTPGRLTFGTTASSATVPTERMRIDSAGRVFIGSGGATTPTHTLTTTAGEAVVFNEQSADIDFRIETNEDASAFVVDGAMNTQGAIAFFGNASTRAAVNIGGIGSATFTPSVTGAVEATAFHIRPAGLTAAASNTGDIATVYMAGTTHTVTDGTHAIGADLYFAGGTAKAGGGTTTSGSTVYIGAAYTGAGTNNYSLFVDAGTSRFDANIQMPTSGTGIQFTPSSIRNALTFATQTAGYLTLGDTADYSGIEFYPGGTTTVRIASTGIMTVNANTASTLTTNGAAVITGGLGVGGRINATNVDAIIGANTAAAGTFTTLTATGNIVASTPGKLWITSDAVSDGDRRHFLNSTYTVPSGANARGLTLDGTITHTAGTGGGSIVGMELGGTFVSVSGAVNSTWAMLNVYAPTITLNTATLTNAATVLISTAPTGASNNYALWVDAGATRLDGTVEIGAPSTANTTALCWDNSGNSLIYDCDGAATDLAENFGTFDPSIEAGDVVSIDPDHEASAFEKTDASGNITKTSKAWVVKSQSSVNIIGVVSTDPNLVFGEDGVFTESENPRPVSLAGRVPVKVTSENGNIAAGDAITVSSVVGVGMKATKAGRVIGIALSSYSNADPTVIGKVIVLVNLHWMGTEKLLALDGNNNLGIGTTSPSFKLDIQDMQVATAAAQIFNTSTATTSSALVLKLGNDSATEVATTNHFLSFETAGIGIVGSIQGNGAKGVTYATSGVADFAEYFRKDSNQNIPFGSPVCLGQDGLAVPCDSTNNKIIGVASIAPAFLGGENLGDRSIAVGLVGQVRTRVSTANGSIKIGDPLTTSSMPGVAVKATSVGQILGKAIEGFDGEGEGEILVSVNISWYNPSIYISYDGALAGITGAVSSLEEQLALQGDALQAQTALDAAAAASSSAQMNYVLENDPLFDSLNNKVSSLESKIDLLSLQFDQEASTSGLLSQIGDSQVLGASDSASLVQSLGDVELNNATIAEDLMVLGRTTVTDLGVTGNISAGMLAIHGLTSEINTLSGDLYLQRTGLGGVDIFDGLIVMDTAGNLTVAGTITAKEIEAENYTVLGEESIGSATILAGTTSIEVETAIATSSSKIFLTTTSLTDKQITVVEKETGKFTVAIPEPTTSPISFDWWIVGNKN